MRLALVTFIVISACISANSIAEQPAVDCEPLGSSEKVMRLQEFLKLEIASKPTWFEHKLSNYPLIVFDHSFSSQCFALLKDEQILGVFPLVEPTQREYDNYDWYKSNYSHIDQEYNGLRKVMDSFDFQRAMIQHFGNSPIYLKPSKSQMGREATVFSIQVHEALHGFVQENSSLWKSPTNPPIDDEDHGPGCYTRDESIAELHKAEFKAAMSMLRHLDDSNRMKQHAKDFVRNRQLRYQKTGELTWTGWYGEKESASCRGLEKQFEYGEGIPQFVEVATLLDLKLATRENVLDEWERTFEFFVNGGKAGSRPLHSYYYTGAIQLLAIRAVLKEDFISYSQSLMNEQSGKSITDHFIKVLGLDL